jgi:hypothetical protein
MLSHLYDTAKSWRTNAGRRKLRLFACGCCRLLWKRFRDPRMRRAVEVAERFAERQATKEELAAAREALYELTKGGYCAEDRGVRKRTAAALARATTAAQAMSAAFGMTMYELPLAGYRLGDMDGNAVLCHLLRCVFGNPFHRESIPASVLAANDRSAARLAQAIYEERSFTPDRLGVLADALEEAGCTGPVLDHLRGPGPHVRGCFAVDLVLGRA